MSKLEKKSAPSIALHPARGDMGSSRKQTEEEGKKKEGLKRRPNEEGRGLKKSRLYIRCLFGQRLSKVAQKTDFCKKKKKEKN